MANLLKNKYFIYEKEEDKYIIGTDTLDLMSEIEYKDFLSFIFDSILDHPSNKDIQIILKLGSKEYEYTLGQFLIQCIYFISNKMIIYKIEEIDISPESCVSVSKDIIHKRINIINERFLDFVLSEKENGYDLLAYVNTEIIERLMIITDIYGKKAACTINLYDIIQFSKRDPVFKDLIDTRLDHTRPTKELEDELKYKYNEFCKTVKKDGRSCLYPFVAANRLNQTQLTQMFIAVGPRTDFNKTIFPDIVRGSFLKGLDNPFEFYAEAVTGRNAAITKHAYVPLSGALSGKFDTLAIHLDLDHTITDCGSTHFINIHVVDQKMLDKIDEKIIYDELQEKLVVVSKKDTHLIGKTVQMRSITTCALSENRCCKTCYGNRADRIKGTRIGGTASIEFGNKLSGIAMSAKHKTSTTTIEIKNEHLLKYFTIDNNRIYFKNEVDLSNLSLVLSKDQIEELFHSNKKGDEDDMFDDEFKPLSIIRLRETLKDGDYIEYLLDDENSFLSLSSDLLEDKSLFNINTNDDFCIVNLSSLSHDIPIFDLFLITEEVSLYLTSVLKILDGGDNTRAYKSVDHMLEDCMAIILKTGIGCSINHVETLIYFLVRDRENNLKRPDFSKNKVDYCLETIGFCLSTSNIYSALSSGYIKRLITSLKTFKNTRGGVYDNLFYVKRGKEYDKFKKYCIV